MRKPIIAGNWKMNNTAKEGVALVNAIAPLVKDAPPIKPPSISSFAINSLQLPAFMLPQY